MAIPQQLGPGFELLSRERLPVSPGDSPNVSIRPRTERRGGAVMGRSARPGWNTMGCSAPRTAV
jgi:hypothetical protein